MEDEVAVVAASEGGQRVLVVAGQAGVVEGGEVDVLQGQVLGVETGR